MNMVFTTFAGKATNVASNNQTREDATDPADDHWLRLSFFHAHLLPGDGERMGVNEINATMYLQRVLSGEAINRYDRNFIPKGVGWFKDISIKYDNTDVASLDAA